MAKKQTDKKTEGEGQRNKQTKRQKDKETNGQKDSWTKKQTDKNSGHKIVLLLPFSYYVNDWKITTFQRNKNFVRMRFQRKYVVLLN